MYQFLRTKSPAVFAMTSPATKPCHEDAISTMPKPDSLAAAVDLVQAPRHYHEYHLYSVQGYRSPQAFILRTLSQSQQRTMSG
ncbi:hypothetical protein CI104_22800 [Citrobacter farmeri]|uniref:Uncharacterized protein n=1 Tax=Citrobacter farmeri TaxID=67824 RepID=A0ACA8DBK0_9ENTR|nr:hypothetical protein CI104_22800 [Citrobacter farmeri]